MKFSSRIPSFFIINSQQTVKSIMGGFYISNKLNQRNHIPNCKISRQNRWKFEDRIVDLRTIPSPNMNFRNAARRT